MDDFLTERNEIVAACQSFKDKGLTLGSWGNISRRAGESILITPSGRDYARLSPADVVLVGRPHRFLPSSELPLHEAIYRARPDVQAIVHTHSLYATAFAAMHESIPALTEDTVQLAGSCIPCASYALAGTEALAEETVKALDRGFAVLLANHGAVACGTSLQQALLFAELIEKAAHLAAVIRSTQGRAVPLAAEDVETLRNFYFQHYAKRQDG